MYEDQGRDLLLVLEKAVERVDAPREEAAHPSPLDRGDGRSSVEAHGAGLEPLVARVAVLLDAQGALGDRRLDRSGPSASSTPQPRRMLGISDATSHASALAATGPWETWAWTSMVPAGVVTRACNPRPPPLRGQARLADRDGVHVRPSLPLHAPMRAAACAEILRRV